MNQTFFQQEKKQDLYKETLLYAFGPGCLRKQKLVVCLSNGLLQQHLIKGYFSHLIVLFNIFQNPNVSSSRKKVRIAPELSDLVVYCQSVTFSASVENDVVNFLDGPCTSLSSFNETKAKSVMVEHNRMAFQRYHQRQLSRIYPKVSICCFLSILFIWELSIS